MPTEVDHPPLKSGTAPDVVVTIRHVRVMSINSKHQIPRTENHSKPLLKNNLLDVHPLLVEIPGGIPGGRLVNQLESCPLIT